jgi:hypothetical protein
MAKYATHITVLLCFAIAGWRGPEIVRAFREPVVAPDVQPVAPDYSDLVRASVADIPTDLRSYALTQYKALDSLCSQSRQPTDDGAYQAFLESVRKDYYGKPYPFKDELEPLSKVTLAEAVNRGLIAADGKAVDWDKAKWQEFARDTMTGLLP